MPSALNPLVMPWLVPVGVALLLVFSFSAGILLTASRVKRWLLSLLVEFARSQAFEDAVSKVSEGIAAKVRLQVQADIDLHGGRLERLEHESQSHYATIKSLHGRQDEVVRAFQEHSKWTAEKLLSFSERTPPLKEEK
jgi:hypothetical protein